MHNWKLLDLSIPRHVATLWNATHRRNRRIQAQRQRVCHLYLAPSEL